MIPDSRVSIPEPRILNLHDYGGRDGLPVWAYYVGRPTKYGNQYSHQPGTLARYRVATVEEAIASFERYQLPDLLWAARIELRGYALACWCWPGSCHARSIWRAIYDKSWRPPS